MKLYQKVGLGIVGLALATASYFSCIKQPLIKHDVQEISQSQTLESKLQNPKRSYNITKEQKDALGYIVKLMQYKGEEKQDYQETKIIAARGSNLDELEEAATENCNSNCIVYPDSDGNYRLTEGEIGSIYFDNKCFGSFKGQGWIIYKDGELAAWGKNKSDTSNIEPQNMIEYEKCD